VTPPPGDTLVEHAAEHVAERAELLVGDVDAGVRAASGTCAQRLHARQDADRAVVALVVAEHGVERGTGPVVVVRP
jgi:hypothetical protein